VSFSPSRFRRITTEAQLATGRSYNHLLQRLLTPSFYRIHLLLLVIERGIGQISGGTFRVKPGSLFPALHRMEEAGWLESSWGASENNRRAKYYQLTKSGRRQLQAETEQWGPYLTRHRPSARGTLMLRRIANLWRNLAAKREVEHQLDAELRSYVDMLEAEKIRSGIDPARARREALLELGGFDQVKEQVRDVRTGRKLEIAVSDLRQDWRTLCKMPFTTAVVVLSLGVGIGVNTTVFSRIQGVVLQPLPAVAQSGSYENVETRTNTGSYPGLSWPEYKDVRDHVSCFRGLFAFRMVPFYVGEPGSAERIYGLLVSDNYFELLGLKPALGRLIQSQDVSRPGGEPIVVISYEYWQTHFNGSPRVLGQKIRINNCLLSVVGV
jgi:DNA-binding PadR family transcriptional regulator